MTNDKKTPTISTSIRIAISITLVAIYVIEYFIRLFNVTNIKLTPRNDADAQYGEFTLQKHCLITRLSRQI